MANYEEVTAARLARRKLGPLYASGQCQMCAYRVPAKALWCSGECAAEYADETKKLELSKEQP
jgi:hypothetical protein